LTCSQVISQQSASLAASRQSRFAFAPEGFRLDHGYPTNKSELTMAANNDLLHAEEKKLRRLGRAMDVATALLWQVNLTLEEAQDVVRHAKHTALQLFPDKEDTFDLIYGARFRRILVEKFHLQ